MIFKLIKISIGNLIKLIWLGKVRGLENIPKKGGCIICANHSSYFDFLMLGAICPRRIYFLAGEVFFKKWQWRWLVKLTRQIRVDRNNKDKSESVKEVVKFLEEGKVVGIFPEGTRSVDGEIHNFYNGAVRIALKTRFPIIPVGIKGTYKIMSRFDKFPKFDRKCDIEFGELINYDVKKDVGNVNIDELTSKLRERIIILYK